MGTSDMQCSPGAASARVERRRFRRCLCRLPIELRVRQLSFPMLGETIDVSPGGCYINCVFPLPLSTEVSVQLHFGQVTIRMKGIVRTADPGVGVGLEFVELRPQDALALESFLTSQEPNDGANSEEPWGLIRHGL